jgi:hypothetical protein
MAINSRLLACKTLWDELYTIDKLALRVGPYFHVLPLAHV